MSHASVPTFEIPKKPDSVPPSSLMRPSTQHLSLTSPSPLPPLCQPPTPNQPPPVSHILDRRLKLRSFNDLKELFELFDKVERGSYAAARLMEAYADVIVNEACIYCWAQHNIVDDDTEDDTDFVDPFPFPSVREQVMNPARSVNLDMDFTATEQQRKMG